jgi:hypothetical protein
VHPMRIIPIDRCPNKQTPLIVACGCYISWRFSYKRQIVSLTTWLYVPLLLYSILYHLTFLLLSRTSQIL